MLMQSHHHGSKVIYLYSKEYQIISPSEGSGQDHNPTPLAERARIAHHSETNPNAKRKFSNLSLPISLFSIYN